MRPNSLSKHLSEPDDHDQKGLMQTEARINHLLRQARKERTWSQAELAELIGVAKETISRWEHGASRPQPNQLRKLCEAFDRKPEELGYAPEPPPADQALLPDVSTTELARPVEPPDMLNEPLSRSDGTKIKPWQTIQPSLTRRHLAAGIALAGLAGGTLLLWPALTTLLTNSEPEPASITVTRQWPTIAYDPYQTLDVVRTIQWMLQARQYDIGSTGVDGYFGPHTLAAVIKFQINQHLQDTGNVDSPTWERLIIPSQMGSLGKPVEALQERLQAFGFLPSQAINGRFDRQTELALRHFQQHMHILKQGVADLNTWCVLVGGLLHTSNN